MNNVKNYKSHRNIEVAKSPTSPELNVSDDVNVNSIEALLSMPHPVTKHPQSVVSLLSDNNVSPEVKDYIKGTLLKPIPKQAPMYDEDEKFPDIIPSLRMDNNSLLAYLKSIFTKSKTS